MSDFDSSVRRISEALVRNAFRPWGLTVKGLENVPRTGPLIVAFNHASLLDGPLVGATIAPVRRPCFLAKKELFDNWFLGWFLPRGGAVPLDRGSADHGALRAALELLATGGSISLSPEGTRVKKGETRTPKPGVSFLSSKSGAKVLPARLVGTGDFPLSYPLEVRFGSPLEPPPEGREAASSFAKAVMDAIYSL
jgi:1-acyl-sn-glycerol-3-phosphate acyltransferase